MPMFRVNLYPYMLLFKLAGRLTGRAAAHYSDDHVYISYLNNQSKTL